MSSKNIQKIVIAFGILAVLLIFLGVNFVPQISAVSSSRNSSIASVNQVRANYLDENYARAIVPALTKDNSDYFLRHMTTGIESKIFTGSDYYERHPSAVVNSLRYSGSDIFERHTLADLIPLAFAGSDYSGRHPSNYYSNSDWFERHPNQTNP